MPYKNFMARALRKVNARTPAQVAVDIGALTDVPAGATIYVDNDNGDDSTGARGSQILPFKTLAVAFTHALSGDVIYISPGTYDQGTTALLIPSNVTVVGTFDRFVHSGFHPPNYRHNRRGLRDWQRQQRFC